LELLESDFQPLLKKQGITIYLFSLQQELLSSFPSALVAAKHFSYSDVTIIKYARSGTVFQKKIYIIIKEIFALVLSYLQLIHIMYLYNASLMTFFVLYILLF
jgi:hypothetical protein